eukprot:5667591-Pleurochrysis_carterae.AAC.1
MAAPPLSLRFTLPVNEAAKRTFPMLTLKCNVITLDAASGNVSFGSVEYPPWVKKWLGWEIFSAVERMESEGLMRVPVPAQLLETVKASKLNRKTAREPKWDTLS